MQRFVAVDTGSHDDTRELLERAVGAPVLKANREAGFGAGVRMATAAFRGAPGLPSTRSDSGDVVDWIWLLDDDSAPARMPWRHARTRRPDAIGCGDRREAARLGEPPRAARGGGHVDHVAVAIPDSSLANSTTGSTTAITTCSR